MARYSHIRIFVYNLLAGIGIHYSTVFHHDFLLFGNPETAVNGEKNEQVERKETISSQSDQTRANRNNRIYVVLAALLVISSIFDDFKRFDVQLKT